ncbi:hypothetical protein WJX77_002176 [Trebouxia sp. C0004]
MPPKKEARASLKHKSHVPLKRKAVIPKQLKPGKAIDSWIQWANVSENRAGLLSGLQSFDYLGTAAINYDKDEDAMAKELARRAGKARTPTSFTISTTYRHRGNEAMHYNSYIVIPQPGRLELHKFDPGLGKWDGMTKDIDAWVESSIKPKGKAVQTYDHSVPLQKCTKDHMCRSWSMAWLLDADLHGLRDNDAHYSQLAKASPSALDHMQAWLEWWNQDDAVANNVALDIAEKHNVSMQVAQDAFFSQVSAHKFLQSK